MPDRATASLDRLAVAGDPRLRRVLHYARSRRDPFSAAEAADALGVHRNVARTRLDRLVDVGFLDVSLERPSGRRGPGAGRPAKIYRVAPEPEGLEFPDRRLAELISLLVTKIPARGRSKALRDVGEEFGRELGASAGLRRSQGLRAGVDRVCETLGSLGFQVSVVSLAEGRAELESPTCPLRPLVTKCPDANGVDQGMWTGLLESAVSGLSAGGIHCETSGCHSRGEACRISLAFRVE